MKPLLSIVIPTRNRPLELQMAIKSAVGVQSRVDAEIVIASNGDTLKGDLEGLDPQLLSAAKIVRSQERLSLSQNWKFGLSHTTGIWMHFLGDDDYLIPDNEIDLTTLLKETKTNGIKFKIAHFDWMNGVPGDCKILANSSTHEIKDEDISSQLGEKWWSISPHKFPTGTAHSLVRREWLLKHGENFVFNSISPDWYTGSIFALSEARYTSVDAFWAAIGNHPNSSIAQMKQPDRPLSKVENLLAKQDGNIELRSLYRGVFPTTWLARTDALVQARRNLFGESNIELMQIVKESYKTTPRYVFKVYQIQKKVTSSFGIKHEFWLITYFCKALFVKLFRSK